MFAFREKIPITKIQAEQRQSFLVIIYNSRIHSLEGVNCQIVEMVKYPSQGHFTKSGYLTSEISLSLEIFSSYCHERKSHNIRTPNMASKMQKSCFLKPKSVIFSFQQFYNNRSSKFSPKILTPLNLKEKPKSPIIFTHPHPLIATLKHYDTLKSSHI
jgi:hypothetical protein